MQTLLRCNQCGHQEQGSGSGILMNKIKMWNHLKREHPMLAERIMKTHDVMPTSFYTHVEPQARAGARPALSDIRPRLA